MLLMVRVIIQVSGFSKIEYLKTRGCFFIETSAAGYGLRHVKGKRRWCYRIFHLTQSLRLGVTVEKQEVL